MKHLGLLNEARGKYGIHGPLEEPLRQLEYLANKSKTKDLGAYVSLDRYFTHPKLSDGERLSFIDQLTCWADKLEKDKTDAGQKYNTLGDLKNPIKCTIVAGIVRELSHNIATKLKRHQFPVIKVARKNYCEVEHAAILYPKKRKALEKYKINTKE